MQSQTARPDATARRRTPSVRRGARRVRNLRAHTRGNPGHDRGRSRLELAPPRTASPGSRPPRPSAPDSRLLSAASRQQDDGECRGRGVATGALAPRPAPPRRAGLPPRRPKARIPSGGSERCEMTPSPLSQRGFTPRPPALAPAVMGDPALRVPVRQGQAKARQGRFLESSSGCRAR